MSGRSMFDDLDLDNLRPYQPKAARPYYVRSFRNTETVERRRPLEAELGTVTWSRSEAEKYIASCIRRRNLTRAAWQIGLGIVAALLVLGLA